MARRPPLGILDLAQRSFVTVCAAGSVYGLYAIWQIHLANLDAGRNYMAALKEAQAVAISEGREPPQKLPPPTKRPA